MSKPLSYSFLSYEDYWADLGSMSGNDKMVHKSFAYKDNHLNDTQQVLASLCNVIVDGPSGIDRYETLAKEKNVTGMAHNLSYK